MGVRTTSPFKRMDASPGFPSNLWCVCDARQNKENMKVVNLPAFEGAREFLIKTGKVLDLGTFKKGDANVEQDMSLAQTLSDFISRNIRQFPADNYALIMWDHGEAALSPTGAHALSAHSARHR